MKRVISAKIKQELKLTKSKIILLIGQRQTGKTYELKRFQSLHPQTLYFDLEDISNQQLFSPAVSKLEGLIGSKNKKRLLLLDEVQYLNKAGSILKLLYDHFPKTKIIATGSASFLLLKNIGDSLYGRSFIFNIYPLTFREMLKDSENKVFQVGGYKKKLNKPTVEGQLNNLMIYGSLPEIYLEQDKNRKEEILKSYVKSLLFKDILEIEGIRMPKTFKQLLQLLALQIGSQVNPNELAQKLEINRKTVIEYIHLFEKFKIIYVLPAFSSNPRREITKGFKIYFSDLGIRNAVIGNFISPNNRTDKGSLFENLVVNIFIQNINYYNSSYQIYFWRTFSGAEIDLVLINQQTGKIIPIEIKYSQTGQLPKSFLQTYKNRTGKFFSINKNNLWKFI